MNAVLVTIAFAHAIIVVAIGRKVAPSPSVPFAAARQTVAAARSCDALRLRAEDQVGFLLPVIRGNGTSVRVASFQ